MWLSVLIFGLSLFSGIWLWLGLSYISTNIGFHDLGSVNPSYLGIMLTSIVGPILISILVIFLIYNNIYIKNIFTSNQAFVKLFQKKLDSLEKTDSLKQKQILVNKAEKLIDDLLLKIATVVTETNILSNEEIKNLWQLYSYGNKYAFISTIIDSRHAASIKSRMETQTTQHAEYADEIIDICNTYDYIYTLLDNNDEDNLMSYQLANSPIARFISIISSFKKAEEKLIEQRLNSLEEFIDDETKKEPEITFSEIEDRVDNDEAIDWNQERNELIDKYRNFASTIKTNLNKGIIDES